LGWWARNPSGPARGHDTQGNGGFTLEEAWACEFSGNASGQRCMRANTDAVLTGPMPDCTSRLA
jgi:hypothetical protein